MIIITENKTIIGILAVVVPVLLLYSIIKIESDKITTFEECNKAGWLVWSRKIPSVIPGSSYYEECVLWGGKSFKKVFPGSEESGQNNNSILQSSVSPMPSLDLVVSPSVTLSPVPQTTSTPGITASPTPTPTPKISEEYLAPLEQAELERFVAPLNASKDEIIDKLFTEGFIKSKEAFGTALASTKEGDNPIESGGYKIAKSMNAWEIVKVLTAKPYMKWVVIPEGLRKEEIADLLASSLGWSAIQKSKWINTYTALKYDYLEGVYFPDTYLIPTDETPQAVANRLTAKFEEKFAPYSKEFAAQGIQWTTAIRMASVVQREAANNADMPLIAGIIWNRLLSDMKLQIDATVQYVRGNTPSGWWAPIKVEDLKIDSKYNTYLYKGLPPHPISNPGLPAIEATLNPAKTDCLFYIHDKDKQTHCAKTYEEHQQNIATYLQ